MTEGTKTAPGGESSQQPLLVVVKGLLNEPPLLFGIGAGIILVGILAATTSLAIVVVVAAIFIAALAAWVFYKTRERVDAGAETHVSAVGAVVGRGSTVGGIDAPEASGLRTNVEAGDARVGENANVGGIRIGGTSEDERG